MVTDFSAKAKKTQKHLRVAENHPDTPTRPFGLFQDTPPLMLAGLTLATAGASLLSVIGFLPRA